MRSHFSCWFSGNDISLTVAQHRSGLVLRWVTVHGI